MKRVLWPNYCNMSRGIFHKHLLTIYKQVLRNGMVPKSWKAIIFTMLPQKARSLQTCDFRPAATSRSFYRVFVCYWMGNFDASLQICQPEKQHRFRPNRGLEERFLNPKMCPGQVMQAQIPVWIVSVDLSMAFDRAHWPAHWDALRAQGISDRLLFAELLRIQAESRDLKETK